MKFISFLHFASLDMSRIGKLPIKIVESVSAELNNGLLLVKGPKGELTQKLHQAVKVEIDKDNKELRVSVENQNDHRERALWGLFRSIINNMVKGVSAGFEKKLEINGICYKANMKGKYLVLNAGFSHPVEFKIPAGITCKTENNIITIAGCDKQLVGEVAAEIRMIRKPEPYQGKGIKYVDEVIRRKAGKAAVKSA